MAFFFVQTNKIFFFLLLFIQLVFILTQVEKCSSILNCQKCTLPNICEICDDGFKLSSDKSQCLYLNDNPNNSKASSSSNNTENKSSSNASSSSAYSSTSNKSHLINSESSASKSHTYEKNSN